MQRPKSRPPRQDRIAEQNERAGILGSRPSPLALQAQSVRTIYWPWQGVGPATAFCSRPQGCFWRSTVAALYGNGGSGRSGAPPARVGVTGRTRSSALVDVADDVTKPIDRARLAAWLRGVAARRQADGVAPPVANEPFDRLRLLERLSRSSR